MLALGHDGAFALNDWSFTQLCGVAGVSKDTVNRLSAETASRVFRETMPGGNKPVQLFTTEREVRSIHGHSYTRLYNADLVAMLMEFAVDFQPPQKASTGGTGLYCGEQDLFAFLIDPTGWAEIGGEAFAPGFFVWNSEVGQALGRDPDILVPIDLPGITSSGTRPRSSSSPGSTRAKSARPSRTSAASSRSSSRNVTRVVTGSRRSSRRRWSRRSVRTPRRP